MRRSVRLQASAHRYGSQAGLGEGFSWRSPGTQGDDIARQRDSRVAGLGRATRSGPRSAGTRSTPSFVVQCPECRAQPGAPIGIHVPNKSRVEAEAILENPLGRDSL